jgi:ribonuclease HI
VQGHAGHDQNELADQLAGVAARNGDAAAYERWQKSKAPDPL